MKRIGFLGAYSIHNTGDLVVGYATRQAVAALVPGAEHVLLAPAFKSALWRHGWGKERGIDLGVTPVPPDASIHWAKGLDALVIGGGGIVSTDEQFRPFLLGDPAAWPGAVPAAWNSVGAEGMPFYLRGLEPSYAVVRRCCERLRYVSVRNPATARVIRGCGYEGELHVVPDPTLLLRLPDDAAPGALLREAGVDTDRVVIGLSVGGTVGDARAASFYRALFRFLLQKMTDRAEPAQIVLFPFGHVYADDRSMEAAAAALPGAKVLRAELGPLLTWRLIGELDFYIGCRFHAALAAFTQLTPFVVLDGYLGGATASSKLREFVAGAGLEALYFCPFLDLDPSAKLESAFAAARAEELSFSARLTELRGAAQNHFVALTRALGLAPGPPNGGLGTD